jgi:Tfp pilus assembly protein PilF
MKRLGLKGTSVAACCMAVCCLAAASGCVSSFGWPTRFGPRATRQEELETQLSLARLSERHGQKDQAQAIYKAVLKKAPENQMAHHRLGVMAARNSRPEEAEAHFVRAAEVAEPTVELLNDMGYLFYLQDRMAEAEKAFRDALQRDPHSKLAHNNLGMVLGEMGHSEESLTEFRLAVGEAEAHSNLAYARSQAGDLRSAEQHFHRALELDDSLRPSAEALIDLAQMRTSLEHAKAAQGKLAGNHENRTNVALARAELPAAPRPATATTDAAPEQQPGSKVIDWRNPIASTEPTSEKSARRPEGANLPAAFRPQDFVVAGTDTNVRGALAKRGVQANLGTQASRVAQASRGVTRSSRSSSKKGKVSMSISDNSSKRTSRLASRIPTLPRQQTLKAVSWEKDTRTQPPEVKPRMPQHSDVNIAPPQFPSNAASSYHATSNPWQRPTWSPESAQQQAQDTTSPITSGIVSPPAKTLDNPYATMPQR